jgi:hypothetical protein
VVPSCCAAWSLPSSRSPCRLSSPARAPSFWLSLSTHFPPCEQSLAAAHSGGVGCAQVILVVGLSLGRRCPPGPLVISPRAHTHPHCWCPLVRPVPAIVVPLSSPPSPCSSSLSSPRPRSCSLSLLSPRPRSCFIVVPVPVVVVLFWSWLSCRRHCPLSSAGMAGISKVC